MLCFFLILNKSGTSFVVIFISLVLLGNKSVGTSENIYDKILEFLGTITGNVAVLEQKINANIQMEYNRMAEQELDISNQAEILQKKDTLKNPDYTLDYKKEYLVQLAKIGTVESYKILEDYIAGPDEELQEWAMLAYHENKMFLESSLLDENQILISTGLGGKGLKLRYFTVLQTLTGRFFSAYEKKLIKSEMQFSLKNNHGELESIHFNRELCRILSVIPLQIPIQPLFDKVIEECNLYGNFIDHECLITNVRILSGRQIRNLMARSAH
jgi:hypothetical protein